MTANEVTIQLPRETAVVVQAVIRAAHKRLINTGMLHENLVIAEEKLHAAITTADGVSV